MGSCDRSKRRICTEDGKDISVIKRRKRLTNSLAMFQTMMKKILQNLINTGEVASFIDNVIVGIEEEKKHDEVVKEVVKRLVKNDLYVKPEKSE